MNRRGQKRGGIDLERVLGTLLIVGVSAAAAVILSGGVLHVIQRGASKTDFSVFRGARGGIGCFGDVARRAPSLRGERVIQFGVLILIFTPVARVLFSVVAFASAKDRLYTSITLLVLTLLALGFLVRA